MKLTYEVIDRKDRWEVNKLNIQNLQTTNKQEWWRKYHFPPIFRDVVSRDQSVNTYRDFFPEQINYLPHSTQMSD